MPTPPEYVSVPSYATQIPSSSSSSATTSTLHHPQAPRIKRLPSFPPSSSPPPAPSRKFGVPSSSSITSNVSDMLLSSLLPPNLPKLPGGKGFGPGVPRELSTRRETLSVPLISNNFRRFVTRVGPLFWIQDRLEEILYWRKPQWTWAWILTWTFISFIPRLLLLLPSAGLMILLLHVQERAQPLPSLLGTSPSPAYPIGTARMSTSTPGNEDGQVSKGLGIKSGMNGTGEYSATSGVDGEAAVPAVPPKEAESGVDYYMNLQAIQNLMGQVSDIYDWIAPRLSTLTSTQPTTTLPNPTAFPLSPTAIILLLLPPTLLLPLLPAFLLPYLLLPLGILPPLFFHPNVQPFLFSLPRHSRWLRIRSKLEDAALNDGLSDEIGSKEIGKVEVWENERLDPAVAAKPPPPGSQVPQGAWSSRNLRGGERSPWEKIMGGKTLWLSAAPSTPSSDSLGGTSGKEVVEEIKHDAEGKESSKKEDKIVLDLQPGWTFIPNEEWRVDVCGLWSDVGTDEDGWVYSDDSWQNIASTPLTESEPPSSDKNAMPGLTLRRITRRRRWWRRIYQD